MSNGLNRREFLKRFLALGAATGLAGCGAPQKAEIASPTPAVPASAPTATPVPPAATATPAPAPATTAPTSMTASAAAAPSATSAAAAPSATSGAAASPVPSPVLTATPAPAAAPGPVLAVAHGAGADPAELTRRAIAALGGIEQFVKKGAEVIVKPNICSASYGYEYAATTNPEVVAAIVALCLGAGAKRVRVMDLPFSGTMQSAYERSGIAKAVGAAGGVMEIMSGVKYKETPIPQGKIMKKWPIYQDALDADVLINVPILKQHGTTGLTIGFKNNMGLVSGATRGVIHDNIHQRLVDLGTVIRPDLTIVDMVRILLRNGPTGGNLNDVKRLDTLVATTDPVAADAYAVTLFPNAPKMPHIKLAADAGLGEADLKRVQILDVAL